MDFSIVNNSEKQYFNQDFSVIKQLSERIRFALINKSNVFTDDLDIEQIINFDNNLTFLYITLFQDGLSPIRWGTCQKNLADTINRNILKLTENKNFLKFDIKNSDRCRIMIEYITEQNKTTVNKINMQHFSSDRLEPGITGMKLIFKNKTYYYMPSDAWVYSHIDLKKILNHLLRKTPIKQLTNKISERINILRNTEHEIYIIKSRAFITYKDEVLPLYRGNTLNNYSSEKIKNIALNSTDWILKYQQDDGKFLYYYDAKEDNYTDHEHPSRKEDNLYYNDLRHCGGIITLIRAYQLTKDYKYIISAKKGINFITSLTKEHFYEGKSSAYIYYNQKAKLGGTALALIALMKYRTETNDKSYDEFIKKYTRHILSRIHVSGEMFGYYIHTLFQNAQPLDYLSEEERKQTFSFYYPGEALLGLALFANYFDDDIELKEQVIQKSKIALNWITLERPKLYSDFFTSLPSDAWLMQAIEEWATLPEFREKHYIDFVLNDAYTMINHTYKENDSPYIDYEGAYYYVYGDHFYPDGSRSEGLIAAYYLMKKLGNDAVAEEILNAARLTAKSQMVLYNSEENSYAHKNPAKSVNSIRFKATRQWIRVDSIQHVACFYFRLYFAEKNITAK